MLTSLPNENNIPLVYGKYILVPFLACKNDNSLVDPNDTPTVIF
jgi:hypothetical protein